MKLSIISPSWFPATRFGGPIMSSHSDAKAFARLGFSVHVKTTIAGTKYQRSLKKNFGKNYAVAYYNFVKLNYQSLRLNYSIIKGREPVVISQDVFWISTLIQTLKVAFSRHIFFIICPRGVLLENFLNSKSRIKKIVFLKLWSCLLFLCPNRFIRFVCTSEAEKTAVNRLFPTYSVSVIPNRHRKLFEKVGTSKIRKVDPEVKTVILVGRISAEKRIKYAIDICADVRKYEQIRFLIAGPDFGHLSELKEYTQENDMDWVEFVGELNPYQLAELYSTADCLLLTSERENFGNVVLEALEFSCPVVCTNGTPWEVLNDFGAGRCVEDSPRDLSDALRSIVAKDKTNYRLACENVLSLFSDSIVDSLWIELFEDLGVYGQS